MRMAGDSGGEDAGRVMRGSHATVGFDHPDGRPASCAPDSIRVSGGAHCCPGATHVTTDVLGRDPSTGHIKSSHINNRWDNPFKSVMGSHVTCNRP